MRREHIIFVVPCLLGIIFEGLGPKWLIFFCFRIGLLMQVDIVYFCFSLACVDAGMLGIFFLECAYIFLFQLWLADAN